MGGASGLLQILPESIQKAMAIDPAPGSSWQDAEHIVFLMQENRSFDHTYGSLQGVRGFNDPRAVRLPGDRPVWLQADPQGNTYAPFHLDIKNTKATWMSSLPHSWANQVDARNDGRYDRWLEAKPSGHEAYRRMPLTLGYHTRADIPFYYALADAFTVCDQNFCSSLTGTTPNRLYFWTGTIRGKHDPNAIACVWNEDADLDTMASWTTYPERLEKEGVSWKVYQNEITADTGFEGEEDPWLGNFGDNPLEYLSHYHIKLHPRYIANLPKAAQKLQAVLSKRQSELAALPAGESAEKVSKLKNEITWLEQSINRNAKEQQEYTLEKYNALPSFAKAIHEKAFTTNTGDPAFRQLDVLKYNDGTQDREMKMPKGDVLHQFREDVNKGKLPTVSWLVAPENFSDHPSAAWYGAWYISEVMDILTKNPEVWKKTIFILTYDENDGYFDHVPPFAVPRPNDPSTGKASAGIDTALEYVATAAQQSKTDPARISPIGLGYRVPMVIASPWSRGGYVNSEVFDHTSSLQFLEKFLEKKFRKKITEENITAWRRAICGDLTSTFRTWNGEAIPTPQSLDRDHFLESIHQAQFKKVPDNYYQLTPAEIEQVSKASFSAPPAAFMPQQEKGTRPASALPYELKVNGGLTEDRKQFRIAFTAANTVFGDHAAGAPFQVYAPGTYAGQNVRTWDYTVKAGDTLEDAWPLSAFANNHYHLRVYGPNGFFREFAGETDAPALEILVDPERVAGKPSQLTGNLQVVLLNRSNKSLKVDLTDNSYHQPKKSVTLDAAGKKGARTSIVINLAKSFSWYDLTIAVNGNTTTYQRFAGKVETGKSGQTDPLMGRVS
ncbi:phospholipase C [Flavihumibacter petaseus NBRC 106054]|uniref:Phospholipase C n=2 Tax=Flavihumibacter TaxID=1004301 RepID=A0A0E9MV90_9BACT|nr:phospholipase C [Flavihumibacter petaseus NBRC 106054]